MAPAERVYTPAEAAVVSGIAIKAINNALDKQVLGARRSRGRRTLTGEDVLLLKVWHGVGSALAGESRNALFEAIRAKPSADRVRAGDLLIIDVAAARRQIKARLKDLAEAEADIHSVAGIMGGEPVFKGTRLPVSAIANMRRAGAVDAELLDGYPGLDQRRLDLATIWADAYPARGRPKTMADYGYVLLSSKRVPLADVLQARAVLETAK